MTAPVVPLPTAAHDAIDASEPLRQLLARRRQAQTRFNVIIALVPPELQDRVCVGGLDAERWTVLAEGPAAAAKLRQLVPRFESALRAAGLADPPLAIRIRSR